ncbi:udp-galactose transporter like [Fusarium longipes]|uniref:Udp-galactose transporter like n=1 Tax=Fusarium longipes TaxID=694270 RepID=A0A395SRS1_9HYPO|nr:udp-galactose transporter like [Fusarium longipes]
MSEVSDIEKQKKQLEDDISKLQGALKHWQTWDVEYEMLKEEVLAVCESNENELKTIHAGFEGELLKDRELDEIFGERTHRSGKQVLNILDRRIDYVTTNIASLQKQISAAEDKLTELQSDLTEDDGLPITEIIEELDDDDNVISYKLNQPDSALPQIQQALEKAGIKDLEKDESGSLAESSKEKAPIPKTEPVPKAMPMPIPETLPSKQTPPQSTDLQTTKLAPSASRGVSFAGDTKMQDGPTPQVSRNAKRVEEIMNHAKEQEKISNEQAYIPEDEDEEDAELRRQMLEYSGEVGAVVAELQLEEGDSDDYEYEEYSDEGFEDDDDQEDKYGRYTGRVVTEDYRQRMLELEKKLGIKSRFTEQPEDKDAESSSDEEDGDKEEGIGRIVVKSTPSTTTSTPSASTSASKPVPTKSNIKEKQPESTNGKKGVRFASTLDIAQESEPTSLPVREASVKEKEPIVEPLSDIVERSTSTKTSNTTDAKSTRKPSRFKKARDTVPPGPLDVPATFIDQDRPTAPTGPEGTTLADTLVERESTKPAQPPNEFDDELILQEVADEHHKLRKKFIQREGGFLKEDESPIQPLEEQDGGRERVSRFKAAKLSRY